MVIESTEVNAVTDAAAVWCSFLFASSAGIVAVAFAHWGDLDAIGWE